MTKRRGLGKGLAELIPAAAPPRTEEVIEQLPVSSIEPNPFQPRQEFDPQELAELAESIRSQGLLQPIIVRPVGDERYQVVAGERRLRATRDLGETTIKAIVRVLEDRHLLELSLVENLIRADLNEIEVAEALLDLQNRYGYTTTELAAVLGKSRPAVSNTLRLLELPASVQGMIRSGSLAAGHGRAVLSFPVEQRGEIAKQCAEKGWSVRELERRSLETSKRKPIKRPRPRSKVTPSSPSALKRAESLLMEHLGTKVKVTEQGGLGTVSITFHGAEDLERILETLLSDVNPL